jgi:eukaryotic-like serine/threonine-protein kinase
MDHRIDATKDLLFGLLALQTGMIDQSVLVAAFQAWSLSKRKPLVEILVEQKAIEPVDRDLLGALVDRHIQTHGDDAELSIAAVGVPGTLHEALLKLSGPELERTLAGVRSADSNSSTTMPHHADFSRSGNDRFRVVRPLARGGIGVVSVAIDTELNREVAFKQIHPSQAGDAASRARFTLEAEVTGRLEHPGVVPVYGLGCDRDGHPYYAMRLIKGESLKDAIARHHTGPGSPGSPLVLRGLLTRFLSVCYAIAYSHSRGIIHRDLKPANVMLGPYGETLVVDWGLAKVVGRDEPEAGPEGTLRPGSGSGIDQTASGVVIGTPAYMSPEQAEGKLEAIGQTSDVYSLGATLYCLLTGKAPFVQEEIAEVIRHVSRGHFPSPRAVNPRISPALEAICLKAMARVPESRYPTVRALAVDLEHWLGDEPVEAFRETAFTRLGRWGRRHKSTVAASVALLATAVIALTVGTIVLKRANDRTQKERDLAQRNFVLARQAVDDYLTRVGRNPLLREKGLHELRKELLEAALSYYQEFLNQRGNSVAIQSDAASAYEHVGDIYRELGRFEDAIGTYDRGLALTSAESIDPNMLAATIRMQGSRVTSFSFMGRYQDGIKAYETAIKELKAETSSPSGSLAAAL